MTDRPDVVVIMTDQERATPPYEQESLTQWRRSVLNAESWFSDNAVQFNRHYSGSLACVPSRPTLFTGQYPDVHGVTQTDGLGKLASDSRMRWLRPGEVPTLGHWFRSAGYDTHYDGKWHLSHADIEDPKTGRPLRTNDHEGVVDQAAVQAYLDADPLDPYGFSGWVGPEPHGAPLANSGLRRDPIIAARVVAWLQDRYARRAVGDPDAIRPFLLVASFVNPHDIVLFPLWMRQGSPVEESALDPPDVNESPTAHEDLSIKPSSQIAYRAAYPTGYGPAPLIDRVYRKNAQSYRNLYYRLHAEVDGSVDAVRQALTAPEAGPTVIVRTADHGELLGSHGGLHQKWFTLYDEATRVPFSITRLGPNPTSGRLVNNMATSHVDVVPTLLDAAGIDQDQVAAQLRDSFTELHPLPGRSLMGIVDQSEPLDPERAVYMMTRDNILDGDDGASAAARRMGRVDNPPIPLRIQIPAHVASNFEAIVVAVPEGQASGGQSHIWKLVRTFDDPDTWSEPGVRHRAATGPSGPSYRSEPLPDQWELYDLTIDPIEARNRYHRHRPEAVFSHLAARLDQERTSSVPTRHQPWPYKPFIDRSAS